MYKFGILVMIILLVAILYIQYDIIQGFTDISDVSGSIIINTVPGAPTITKLIPGTGSIQVEFTPGSTGGATITNYKYSTDDGVSYTTLVPAKTTSPITITGLTKDTSYKIRIRAINSVGNGAESTPLEVTYTAKDLNCEVTPEGTFQLIGSSKIRVAKCIDSATSSSSTTFLQNLIDILSSNKLSKDPSGNYMFDSSEDKTSSDAEKLSETTKLIKDLNETLKSDKLKERLDSLAGAKSTTTTGGVSTTTGTGGGLTGTNTMCSFPAPTCESPVMPVSGASTDCLQQGTEMNKAPVDMSQYVRKDSIPCWGCTLDY